MIDNAERMLNMKNVNDIARSLYDGGWRCEEAYEICSELELLEREGNND